MKNVSFKTRENKNRSSSFEKLFRKLMLKKKRKAQLLNYRTAYDKKLIL